MAIVRGMDGTFYEVPDDQLGQYKVPEDQLKAKLGEQPPTAEPPPGGGGAPPGPPLVNVHIYYSGQGPAGAGAGAEESVQPYDWRNWRNWSNWRNWRNKWD
jgi:hypothetical protein